MQEADPSTSSPAREVAADLSGGREGPGQGHTGWRAEAFPGLREASGWSSVRAHPRPIRTDPRPHCPREGGSSGPTPGDGAGSRNETAPGRRRRLNAHIQDYLLGQSQVQREKRKESTDFERVLGKEWDRVSVTGPGSSLVSPNLKVSVALNEGPTPAEPPCLPRDNSWALKTVIPIGRPLTPELQGETLAGPVKEGVSPPPQKLRLS